MRLIAAVLLMFSGQLLASSKPVFEKDHGSDWPFTDMAATLVCRKPSGRPIATVIVLGKTYALNGNAEAAGNPPLDPVWRDNPDIPGAKISISGMLREALALCN